jgi:predicted lysophospholipase L1 biosynthesis ABC-type transport system permease subunit
MIEKPVICDRWIVKPEVAERLGLKSGDQIGLGDLIKMLQKEYQRDRQKELFQYREASR